MSWSKGTVFVWRIASRIGTDCRYGGNSASIRPNSPLRTNRAAADPKREPRTRSKVVGAPPHDFDNDDAPVALGSGVEFIQSIAAGINGRIEAEADVGTADIVVDCLGDPNKSNALLVESPGDAQRAVAADDSDCVKTQITKVRNDNIRNVALDDLSRFAKDRIAKRVGRIRGAKNSSAQVKNSGNAGIRHRPGPTMHQAVESVFDSDDLPAVTDGGFHGCPDDGIQGRTIAAACQYP